MRASLGTPAPITPPASPGEPPPEEMPEGPEGPEPGVVPDYPPPEEEPQPAVIPDQPHQPLPAEDPLPIEPEPEPNPEPAQPPGEDPVPAQRGRTGGWLKRALPASVIAARRGNHLMRIGEPNMRNRPQASGRSRDRRDRLHPFGPPSACEWLGDETRVDATSLRSPSLRSTRYRARRVTRLAVIEPGRSRITRAHGSRDAGHVGCPLQDRYRPRRGRYP